MTMNDNRKAAVHTFIVYKLSRAGIPQASLAREFGVSPAMINYVITGRKQSPELQQKIARRMGFEDWASLEKAAGYFQEVVRATGALRGVANA